MTGASKSYAKTKSRWTPEQLGDQHGKTFVITGANSGLGLITARELAVHGGQVIMAVRDIGRGEAAASAIREIQPDANVSVQQVDLLDLASIRSGVERIAESGAIDVLVNNAGIAMIDYAVTAAGVEKHFAANHLGHFALTALLSDSLRRAPSPRVVTVTSYVHANGRLDLDDIGWSRRYSRTAAYSASKLANALFGVELARRGRSADSPITSVLAHPGYANTPMQEKGPRGIIGLAMRASGKLLAQSPERGALPQLYAATQPGVPNGSYIGPDGRGGRSGFPTMAELSPDALDVDLAKRLWALSEDLTGITF